MANWSLPTLSDTLANVLSYLKLRDVDAATLFLSIPTNPPDGAIRIDRLDYSFTEYDIDVDQWIEFVIPITSGGTGANTPATARAGLGLGSIATQASNNVAITGGTIGGMTSIGCSGTISAGLFSGSGASLTNIPNAATSATNLNTPSAIVARDASGNFSAGTITATISGTVTNGIVSTGSYSDPAWITALSATKLTSGTLPDARLTTNVPLKGDASNVFTGKASFLGQPRQKAYRSLSQAIQHNLETPLILSANIFDTGHGLIQLGLNDSLLFTTGTGAGSYRVTAQVTFLAGGGTIRKAILYVGGNPIARAEAVPSASVPTVLNFSALYEYTAGGDVTGQVKVYQDSGGDLDAYGADQSNTYIEVLKEC